MKSDPNLLREFTWDPLTLTPDSLPPHLHGIFYDGMVTTMWLMRISYNVDDGLQERIVAGVCISSLGHIITSTAGTKPTLVESEYVDSTKFEGRRYNEEFQELDLVMEDEELGLSVFKVKKGDYFNYAGVDDRSLDSVGYELFAIDCSVPFSFKPVTNALCTSTFGNMAEEAQELSTVIARSFPSEVNPANMAHNYLPIQGMVYTVNFRREDKVNVWTSQSGTTIFNNSGAIVLLVCMGDPSIRPSLVYAIPGRTICECIRKIP